MNILMIEGDEAHAIEMNIFSADACLEAYAGDREDAEDWGILEDENIAGMHYVMLGEDVEGDTVKFIARV